LKIIAQILALYVHTNVSLTYQKRESKKLKAMTHEKKYIITWNGAKGPRRQEETKKSEAMAVVSKLVSDGNEVTIKIVTQLTDIGYCKLLTQ